MNTSPDVYMPVITCVPSPVPAPALHIRQQKSTYALSSNADDDTRDTSGGGSNYLEIQTLYFSRACHAAVSSQVEQGKQRNSPCEAPVVSYVLHNPGKYGARMPRCSGPRLQSLPWLRVAHPPRHAPLFGLRELENK
ncbi:hypothetical protein E2C01_101320 [Portunus trituberculatus]|uniref:Uncharacterized protein n=1 Tax=Portunus trituberculatus TaxID=210409 RepID=A0A5B7KEG5_PORTR|nr:hypothetical protein [Portunus trituberculatus]